MRYKRTKTIKLTGIKWKQYSTYIMMLFIYPVGIYAQNGSTETVEKRQKELRPTYLNIGFGLNLSNFRDFATSPLVYSGNPLYTSLSHIDIDEHRESHFTASYSFGTYESNFNQHNSESNVKTVSLNYLELFQLKKLSTSKVNLKIGAQFNSTFNYRENAELFNNSKGVDIISTLFGSAKTTLDLSRKEQKSKKFLFINYKLKKRVRRLAFTMNVGVVNSSYRNGFAYTSPSALLNEDNFFAGYEFQIFKGFRLNTSLDYTIFLNERNAFQFSYLWDAYRTGGHHNNFEMVAHILKFSLLFGLK